MQRTPLEIGRNDERSAWIDLVAQGPRGVTVSFKAAQAARDASAFQDLTRNNSLTRRFYQAAREERVWRTACAFVRFFRALGGATVVAVTSVLGRACNRDYTGGASRAANLAEYGRVGGLGTNGSTGERA